VAWLTARFPSRDVVVVESAKAAVWKGRALRGVVGVATRTDLWRLLAHARLTVDLRPGNVIARECIESLRFGTPIIVPKVSVARHHAEAGGGLSYEDISELLAGVKALEDDVNRSHMSEQGRKYADLYFGDLSTTTDTLAHELFAPG
jgi:glycosyltransferase involved in cell wall biosynthesis